ncbi:hypothetical protein [Acetobacter oeni]|uniref:Lipoprotein n=1 Tax=Acetobacter oeni TaxID=304077 RepID=A0A511XPB8_9PROT|nr:hypothetical protein [Acetobacter oeni]MBB3884604.1 hypothetical protein [Acetobacter oeni]NHO20542.1 hypothetical protein [Acetobacter oeni]GBR07484.1 hypothetical protein AA21952_2354 [Acetobacter oeni LMG 21952]GEN64812.1 hypothetical protein AOE01nite_30360 [Acetobacter oeni]
MKYSFFLPLAFSLGLSACSAGNVSSAAHVHGPKAPRTKQARYDPNAAYGSARAVWTPPTYNRAGTIVRPDDPRTTQGREDYEHASWATGAQGGDANAPPGTF